MASSPQHAIRSATRADAAGCAEVYAPYVLETAISFEARPPTAGEMEARIAASLERHEWLVLEDAGRVVGYAYAAPHNSREAYRWATDVSVYLEVGRRRTGAGRALYEALFSRLRRLGYRIAVAGITLPNEASAALHRALGFEPVGVYRGIGYKFGAWHDVEWLQLALVAASEPIREPAGAEAPPPFR